MGELNDIVENSTKGGGSKAKRYTEFFALESDIFEHLFDTDLSVGGGLGATPSAGV